MPGETVLQVLHHVWQALAGLSVPSAVIGGLAVSAWKHIRATHDVDLLVEIELSRLPEILSGLRQAKIHHRRTPPILTLDNMQVLQLAYAPGEFGIDVCVDLVIADSEFEKTALARAQETQQLNGGMRVVRCDDLILFKLMAGRLIDRADAAYLLRLNPESIDLEYLRHWTERLSLGSEFDAIWHEAFATEPPKS